jgi:hypothetical protein
MLLYLSSPKYSPRLAAEGSTSALPRPLRPRADTGSPGSHARCFSKCTGSLTARDQEAPRDIGAPCGAFRFSLQRRPPGVSSYAAEYPAHTFLCQRFDAALSSDSA